MLDFVVGDTDPDRTPKLDMKLWLKSILSGLLTGVSANCAIAALTPLRHGELYSRGIPGLIRTVPGDL